MTGFLEEKEGVKSMGRLQVLIGCLLGVGLAVTGAITKNMALVYAGIGLVVGEGIVKGVQKAGE